MRIVVYDLETKNKPQNQAQWKDWPWMGISVGCAYDFSTNEYSVYLDDNLPKLIDLLNSADLVAAFNHISFDNNLLAGVAKERGLQPLAIKANYDMLVESRTGAKVDMYAKGFKLDAHLKATLHIQKTGDGGDAPALFTGGKMGELVSYCLADVHRERLLFEHIWGAGYVVCEHGSHAVRKPQDVLGIPNTRLADVGALVIVGQTPMHVGIDMAASPDRTVVVQHCNECDYLHEPGTPHIYLTCSYCGHIHVHGTPHIEPHVAHDAKAVMAQQLGVNAPKVETTNPEDL